jgi:uncharacterized protein YfaS (alpha-2-macroglobulin family)
VTPDLAKGISPHLLFTNKSPLQWVLKDAMGAEVSKGQTALNAFGAFDFSVELSDTMHLGVANIEFTHLMTPTHFLALRVEEFRRPEFEISSKILPVKDHIATRSGGHVIATATASYFAGGPLTEAAVNWTVKAASSSYRPPLWHEFNFEEPRVDPTWDSVYSLFCGTEIEEEEELEVEEEEEDDYEKEEEEEEEESRLIISPPTRKNKKIEGFWDHNLNFQGISNTTGEHELKIEWQGSIKKPVSVQANAVVMDKNNQALQTGANWMVHPSEYYVGYRCKKFYGKPKVLFKKIFFFFF